MRGLLALVASFAAGAALVAVYVAAGGTDYHPSAVADPCAPRADRPTSGTDEALEAVVLAAADRAACALGASREDLVLALRSVDELERLAAEQGLDRDELEQALRESVVAAAEEAAAEGLIGERAAGLLTTAAQRFPLSFLLTVLREVSRLLD